MKLVSVDYHSINCLSGIATFNRNLAHFFCNNIEFITVYQKERVHDFKEDCLNIPYKFPFKLLNYISNYRLYPFFISKKLKNYDNSVIIFNSPSLLKYYRKGNNKAILVQHQDFSVMFSNKSGFANSFDYLVHVFDSIDYFVCLSEQDRKKFEKNIPCKYHFKLRVIPHTTQMETGISKKSLNRKLLMLGRLDNQQKRFDLAINAMNKLPDWKLSIFGDGKDRVYIETLIEKSQFKNINLHNYTSDVQSVLDCHDVHIMTSDFEGYPITNIEAVTRGMPLIVRDTFSSASDIIDDNGVLLERDWSENSFISAIKQVELNFESYSKNSIEISERFSVEQVSRLWSDLVQECYQ
ncbi:TPA: glycosyltransferase [Vibrio harveyi]